MEHVLSLFTFFLISLWIIIQRVRNQLIKVSMLHATVGVLDPRMLDFCGLSFKELGTNSLKSACCTQLSTVVHSTTIPPNKEPTNKERPNPRSTMDKLSANIMRASQALPQRFPVATKPGKVVGPVMSYESGGLKDAAYDPRRIIPPQHSNIPPECCFHRGSGMGKIDGSSERGEQTVDVAEKGMSYVVHLPPHPSCNSPDFCLHENSLMSKADRSLERNEQIIEVAEKRMDYVTHHHSHGMPLPPGKATSSDVAIDMRRAPFFNQFSAINGGGHEVPSSKLDERITMEANLFHVQKPHFSSGIAAAASVGGGAHHRKVGTVQFGMTRMY